MFANSSEHVREQVRERQFTRRFGLASEPLANMCSLGLDGLVREQVREHVREQSGQYHA